MELTNSASATWASCSLLTSSSDIVFCRPPSLLSPPPTYLDLPSLFLALSLFRAWSVRSVRQEWVQRRAAGARNNSYPLARSTTPLVMASSQSRGASTDKGPKPPTSPRPDLPHIPSVSHKADSARKGSRSDQPLAEEDEPPPVPAKSPPVPSKGNEV